MIERWIDPILEFVAELRANFAMVPPPFKSFLARHQAPLNLSASFVSNVVFDAHETSFRAQFYNPPSPPSFFSLSRPQVPCTFVS